MEFIHTNTTRRFIYLIPGILFLAIGIVIVPVTFYGLYIAGDSAMWFPFLIGLALLVFGTLFIYQFIFPRVGKGVITEYSIRCELNGKLKQEIFKTDIDHITFLTLSGGTGINAIMKSGKGLQKVINPFYFYDDLDRCREELETCGYKVISN